MAKYTGPRYKRSRRVGFSTLENGKDLAKRPYGPGQHGQGRKGKLSNYGIQLTEKQKVKFMYGLNERQFKNLFEKASKLKGIHGEDFLKLLESRLDNLVYKMGFASSRKAARQLVNHGHVLVNGKKVNIPSYSCIPGDVITIREKSKDLIVIKNSLEQITSKCDYVTVDDVKLEGTYVRLPERSELNLDINESLIVEFYSR